MAPRRVSKSRVVHRGGLARRLLLAGVYLLAISGLIAWELRDHLDEVSSSCAREDLQRSAPYSLPYNWFLRHASEESVTQVSVVAFAEDLPEINGNLCLGRSYMADILRSVATQNPSVIVIDRFYGTSTCKAFPETTAELTKVLQTLRIPVIVGESTLRPDTPVDGACLCRQPQLDFATPYVHRGLTRLNTELEKVPLQWLVASSDGPGAKAELADSLSLAAVEAYDSSYSQRDRIQKLIRERSHPYASLDFDLPRQTSTQLLCDSGTPDMRQRWSVHCLGPVQPRNLLGRIVVVGSEGLPDQHLVLGSKMWGFDLQAHYIQALLSGHYLHASPPWVGLLVLGLFVFVVEGLPTFLEAFRPHWKKHRLLKHAFQRRRYVWIVFCVASCLFGTVVLSLSLGFLPPLISFGDILLVAVTRLLLFAAESSEVPLTHAK